jgi:cellulose biosynthesis protein BcsQ
MSSIKGSELKLHKVFSSDFQFEIPDYQRPYSWQVEHAEELFDDLWTFREQEDISEEYFLGSFSVMNDRGMDLAPSDILKANIISSIGEHERERYTELWEDIEDRLGRENFNDLFAHIRMIVRKEKYRRSVLDEFTDYVVTPTANSKRLMDELILPYADTLEVVLNNNFKSEANAARINRLLQWLHYLNNKDWVPVAMKFIRKFDRDTETLRAHLQKLERLGASMFIRGIYATPRIERFGQVLRELEQGKNLLDEGSALDLNKHEQRDTLYWLNANVYRYSNRLRSYILMRMDSFLSDHSVSYKDLTKTIEHVLPQTPATDSEWRTNWTDDEREYWVDRIGNLLLLSRKKNSEASNYDFTKKKERYFKTKSGVSNFATSTDVLNYDAWTPEEVEERQRKLIKLLGDKWSLDAGVNWERRTGKALIQGCSDDRRISA